MNLGPLVLLAAMLSLGVATCNPKSQPVKSLCLLDVQAGTCWINKEGGEGLTFNVIEEKGDLGMRTYCVDENDLDRIFKKISTPKSRQ